MLRFKLSHVFILVLLGAVVTPSAYAFECPVRHKEARQTLNKARVSSQQISDPAKLVMIEEMLELAEEKLNESETAHFGAKNTADHATSVRMAYEAIGLAKEAYYLATK